MFNARNGPSTSKVGVSVVMDVELLLVPYDTARRGWRCGAGPEHLVGAGLIDHLHASGHRVVGTQLIEDDPAQSPAEIRTAFELMRRLATAVRKARAAGHFPLILSGNCNVAAVGALSGLTPAARSVFWFDAHGESNTPDTTGSGFLDGMGLSINLGWCWRALAASVPGFQPVPVEATFLLGARDLDPLEAASLFDSQVNLIPASRLSALSDLLAAAAPSDRPSATSTSTRTSLTRTRSAMATTIRHPVVCRKLNSVARSPKSGATCPWARRRSPRMIPRPTRLRRCVGRCSRQSMRSSHRAPESCVMLTGLACPYQSRTMR